MKIQPRTWVICGVILGGVAAFTFYWWGSARVSPNDPQVQQSITAADALMPTIRGERERLLKPGQGDMIPSRGLASVAGSTDIGQMKAGQESELGRDSWGQAFRYRILVGTENAPERVAIWSAGKNTKFDAQFGDLRADLPKEGFVTLENDDFAVIHSM